MGLTSLVYMVLFAVGIILTLYHPMYGVVFYFFEWHNHPREWWWGRNWPDPGWSFLVAVLIVISLIINRKKLSELFEFHYKPFIWFILIVINAYVVSLVLALDPSESFRKSEVLLKLAANYFLMIYIIRNPKDYKLLIFVILLCVANFGRVAWMGGSNRDLGISAPGASSGNLVAAYMMSIVPLFAVSFFAGNKWMKAFVIISLAFVLNALILENSRGTILGLASMGALAPFLMKGKMRFKVIIALAFGAIMFMQLANEQFWERQSTTVKYKQESTAMSRFLLWKGAYRFLQDHPFGGGGEGFYIASVDYIPELGGVNRVVHNTYLNFATDWGYFGIFLLLGFIIHTYVILRKVQKNAKKVPNSSFYYFHSIGLLLALTGTLVSYIFYSRQYQEHLYWFCAFAVALWNMQLTDIKKTETAAEEGLLENNKEESININLHPAS